MPTKKEMLSHALTQLRRARLKVTPARRAILATLIEKHGPFKIEDLHKGMKGVACDLVTVYRALSSLEEIGLVQRCEYGDGISRFEFHNPARHHHHIFCKRCDRTDTVDTCPLETLDPQWTQMGYQNIQHSVSFFGVCRQCSGNPS